MGSEGYVYEAVVLVVCGVLLIVKLLGSGKRERFPPGPFAWPIVGNVHLLSNLPHQALRDVAKTYGHLVGLRLGQHRAVVVSSPELAKEVLNTHDKVCANRPPFQFTLNLFYTDNIGFSPYGPHWRKQRKICVMDLFTVKRLQELEFVRQEELGLLLRRIDDEACSGTGPVDIGRCVGSLTSRLIMRLLQSKATVEVAGENLHELITEMEKLTLPTLGDLFPWLSCFDFLPKWRMRRLHARLDKVLSAIVAKRKQSASHQDDLLHTLLSKEVDLDTALISQQESTLTFHEIKSILLDMMTAGIHTTAVTLEWAMAQLLKSPDRLHRLRKEIDTVVGNEKQVMDADVAKMSYLKCVVKEVFRLHPVLPLLIPRISTEECKMQGYILPKNTIMFVNAWAIGRDDKLWPNANEFLPERFEGKDMDVKGQHFELLPFGAGRRSCVGMALGLSMVEVTLANLVKSYDWELPYGQTLTSINMDEKHGFTLNRASPVIAIPKRRVWPA